MVIMMSSHLTEKDQEELQRRRLSEDVYKSVEETLKRRYTWLAIVISFVLGGGVVLATNQLTKSATNTLTRHQVLLEQAENALENVNKLAGSAQQQLEAYRTRVFATRSRRQNFCWTEPRHHRHYWNY